MSSTCCGVAFVMVLFFIVKLVFLEGDAFVEFLFAIVTLGEEVEADTADMLLSLEIFEIVDLVAFDFELHHAPVFSAAKIHIF